MVDDKTKKFLRAQIEFSINARLLVNAWGGMAPVNNNCLPFLGDDSIVFISEDVYKKLQEIQKKTRDNKQEIPFLLYGETRGQRVVFNKIDVQADGLRSTEADFSTDMIQKLQNFIDNSKKDGSDIVAHGHSHPPLSTYYKNFSKDDLKSYMNFRFDNPEFNDKKIELCSCLLAGENFNFLFFDGNDFYKFANVVVFDDNAQIIKKLPCYQDEYIYNRNNQYGM